jgi:hypothetical protein
MKISVKKSGGFAGISMPAKVLETTDQSIKDLAYEALEAPGGSRGMDMMSYEITIEEDGQVPQVLNIKNQLPSEKASALIDMVCK